MDILGLFWIPNFLVWIIAIAIALYLYGIRSFGVLSVLGYSGPKPKPFLGNIDIMMTATEHFGARDTSLKKEYGDIVALYEGNQPTLVVFDRDVIKHVMVKDFSHFTDRRKLYLRGKLGLSLIDLEGTEWHRVRSLVSSFFSTAKIKHHMILLNKSIDSMLVRLDEVIGPDGKSTQPMEMKEVFGEFAMDSICRTAFGIEVDSNSEHVMVDAAKRIMAKFQPNLLFKISFMFPFLGVLADKLGYDLWPAGTMEIMIQVIEAAIEERQKSKEVYPDFIQAMIKAHEEELDHEAKEALGEVDPSERGKGLTNDEIISQAVTFLMAGYDTTSTTLSFVMFNLAKHPEWQERAVKEIEEVIGNEGLTYDNIKKLTTIDMCLDESMRLYPSIFRLDRKVRQDITINSNRFPKDSLAVIPVYALHRDPDFWTDPEVYDPERFSPDKKKDILNSYMYHPFGTGPRACVAMRFALIEVKMAMVRLLQKYKWTVSEKTCLPITLEPYFFAIAKGGLWLNAEKRVD